MLLQKKRNLIAQTQAVIAAGDKHRPERGLRVKGARMFRPLIILVLTSLIFVASQAQAATGCGNDGQRACCVASTERDQAGGACRSGNAEIPGCTGVGDCKCGGSGLAPLLGSSSSSRCEAITQCGGDGQRACCLLEQRWDDNPVLFSAGCEGTKNGGIENLTEIALPGGVSGGYCGGFNPFQERSNGICRTCGSDGARECVGANVGPLEKCQSGLASVAGWCQQCGGNRQLLCRDDSGVAMCLMGFHPDGGKCLPDTVIAEPDCDCEVEGAYAFKTEAAEPVVGYADLHLHLFSNLAFGGMTLWGEAFHPEGGISQALRADNFAQRTLRHQINGNTVKGIATVPVAPDIFREQTIVHGDDHPFLEALVGHGTGEGSVPNGGVEWDPVFANDRGHFTGWPKDTSTTHQQAYHRWLQRAHKGGLQLTVMLAVNNEAMCAASARLNYPEFDCADTMAAVRLQLQAAKDMEAWLAQECKLGREHGCAKGEKTGVPPFSIAKKGWFKVVYSPEEARAAIADGQMAAVLGIEESFLFDCRPGSDTCNEKHVRQELDKYQKIGVRHVFPLHNFDNAFGGTATWQDTVAIGNRYSTGSWFGSQECPQYQPLSCLDDGSCPADQKFGYDAKDLFNFLIDTPDIFVDSEEFFESFGTLFEGMATLTLGFGETGLLSALENKPPGDLTTCNNEGLTSLGGFLIQELMVRGMIIDIDHMSSISVDNTLSLAEDMQYPGIVASHVQMLDLTEESARHERMRSAKEIQRIAAVGGMIGVMTAPPDGGIIEPVNTNIVNTCANSSMTWGQSYEYAVEAMGVPVAFGTDFNGIAAHTGPRLSAECLLFNQSNLLSYPFTLDGFGSFNAQKTGGRTFNFNSDGLAHVGLLPDMVHDLKQVGLTDETLEPLFSSAEKYISMWEGAELAAKDIDTSEDTEPPVLALTYSTPANDAGWHNQPFTIEIKASDENRLKAIVHSTIETPASFRIRGGIPSTISIPVALDEFNDQFFAIAYDVADNDSGMKFADIKIDQLPPLISANHSPQPNTYEWINEPVTVVYQCEDGFSGVRACTDNQVLESDGAAQSAVGSVEDFAGNNAQVTVLGINIDQTPPTIVATQLPLANAAGWINKPVTVAYQCADSLSGVQRCSSPETLLPDGAAQSAVGSVEDLAGNKAQVEVLGINIDQTPPTIVATALPLPNAAGWINKVVTISYRCNDSLSGLVSCPETNVLSSDAAEQEVLAVVSDLADNTARADIAGINIDQEPPLVEISGVEDGGDYFLGQVPIAGCVTTDSLSGVLEEATLSISGGTSNSVGLYTASCDNAVDEADNTSSESASYWVRYIFDGFHSPVGNLPTINKAKAGSSIPIKFSLSGNHGLDIFANGSPISRSVSCDTGATINDTEEAADNPGSRTLAYKPKKDQYSYVWKTNKPWSGSCREFLLNLDDGSEHAAIFRFK